MFGIGSSEMVILLIIGLLLFGKNLPDVARKLGKGVMEFKKGMHGIEDELYTASNRPANVPQSRPLPSDEREEAIAPKFEPPKSAPADVTAENQA
jgi:sec-independent protein translocase protein TatA